MVRNREDMLLPEQWGLIEEFVRKGMAAVGIEATFRREWSPDNHAMLRVNDELEIEEEEVGLLVLCADNLEVEEEEFELYQSSERESFKKLAEVVVVAFARRKIADALDGDVIAEMAAEMQQRGARHGQS